MFVYQNKTKINCVEFPLSNCHLLVLQQNNYFYNKTVSYMRQNLRDNFPVKMRKKLYFARIFL